MKRSLLILLGCLCSLLSFAQTNKPFAKTLLWRISGKNLSKPSYLYGTMHLTDERLFNFSDSLLLAIEQSEGFAIELDPDEMMGLVMEQMFNDIKKAKLLKDVVSKKAFAKYAPLLAKRLKKEQDEITVKDVVQEQNKWMQEAYNNGTMPTFVDTWLFDIARRQGKWVGGIEDVQDQAGLLEDVFNEQDLEFLTADYSVQGKKFLNSMIEMYEKQDISELETFVGDRGRKDLLLLRRNIKMAYRMDSLSAIRSMVFAVGAAHLAGDSGVIDLLRKKGFVVEPVFSDKKIAGKNYKLDAKPVAWQKITDNQGLYEVEMPGKASPIKMYGVLEMRLNFNLFTSSGYLTMALPSNFTTEKADSMMLVMARAMMQDPKLKQGKAIIKNGMNGREYIGKGADGFKRAQAFSNGKTVYLACAFFNKEANVMGEDAQHFFNSLVLRELEKKSSENVSFSGIFPGVQGEAPVALEYNKEISKQAIEKDWSTTVYAGLDQHAGAFYMLISKGTMNDTYIPNDSIYLGQIRDNSKDKFERKDLDTLLVDNGIYTLEQKGPYKEKDIYFHGKSYVKGNRCYSFFAIVPASDQNKATAAKVVASFKLVPPPLSKWQTHTAESYVSTWAPSPFLRPEVEDSSIAENNVYFNAKDSNSSYAFSILKTAIDTNYWYNGKQDYWDPLLAGYVGETDTLLSKAVFTSNGLDGYDLVLSDKNLLKKNRMLRLFNYGDTLYTMFSCVSAPDAENADIRRFFTDIKFSRPAPATSIFTSKAQQFIGRLYSADSATHGKSFDGLYQANFSKNDIPLLREALMEHYGWDTSYPFYTSVQMGLGHKLQRIGDSTLSDFIKSRYENRNGRDDDEQTSLLALLQQDATTANMRFVMDALTAIDGNSKINEEVLRGLDDSLELIKPILSEALRLLDKPNMTDEMTAFAKRMLDSNLVQPNNLLPYEPAMIAFGQKKLQELNAESDGWGYPLAALSKVAGHLKTPASMGFLKQMLGSKHNAVKMEAIYGLLEAEAPLPENVLQSIAGDRSLRAELWDALVEKKKDNLFPKAFKTQQLMGESNIYNTAADEDTPSNIVFLSSQKTTINEKPATVYFYKIVFSSEEDKTNYLGAVAFPADPKNIEPLSYSSLVLWDEEYNVKNAAKQTKTLLAEIKEMMKPE